VSSASPHRAWAPATKRRCGLLLNLLQLTDASWWGSKNRASSPDTRVMGHAWSRAIASFSPLAVRLFPKPRMLLALTAAGWAAGSCLAYCCPGAPGCALVTVLSALSKSVGWQPYPAAYQLHPEVWWCFQTYWVFCTLCQVAVKDIKQDRAPNLSACNQVMADCESLTATVRA